MRSRELGSGTDMRNVSIDGGLTGFGVSPGYHNHLGRRLEVISIVSVELVNMVSSVGGSDRSGTGMGGK